MYVGACGEQKLMLGIFLPFYHISFIFELGFLTELAYTLRKAGYSISSRDSPISTSPALGSQVHVTMSSFYVGAGVELKSSCFRR